MKIFPLLAVLAVVLGGQEASASPPLGSSWSDIQKMPDFFTGNWQSVSAMVDVSDGAPYTDKAKAYIVHYKPIHDIPYAGPTCKTPGMPIIQRAGSPLKFFFQPGLIAIYIENDSATRFIKLNGEHDSVSNPTYLGDSVAHFEGDTLVVESTDFADDIIFQYGVSKKIDSPFGSISGSIFGPHGPNMKMVERIRLIDADTLEDRLTVYDDTVWTKPYVSMPVQIFKRNRGVNGLPREWQCTTAIAMPFDVRANKAIIKDPAEALEELEKQTQQ